MAQILYLNIHKHGPDQKEDEIAVKSVFAHDIHNIMELHKGLVSIGLHPWHAGGKNADEQLIILEEFASFENVIAIGEIGLDRNAAVPLEIQMKIFIRQLEIAQSVEKPVIIHCVKTHSDIISILKTEQFKEKVIFHGFNQNIQIVEQILKNGFYLSFGQTLMNNKSNASKLFCDIPDERFFLETDEAEIDIKEIYKTAAHLKNTTVAKIKKSVSNNFAFCFNLSD